MTRFIISVVMVLFTITARANVSDTANTSKAKREARREAYSAEIDAIVRSRNYIFRPITMQNVVTGNTRSIFAYYLYAGIEVDGVNYERCKLNGQMQYHLVILDACVEIHNHEVRSSILRPVT